MHLKYESSVREPLVDGHKTLGELYRKVRGSYFRFLTGAYRLCVGMVLDIEEVVRAELGGELGHMLLLVGQFRARIASAP